MPRKILAATELRQRLREVLGDLEKRKEPYYVTQRSRPMAVLARYDSYESLVQRADDGDESRSALRWCLGFIANLMGAMEEQGDLSKYVELMQAAARQGLKMNSVPKGVLNNLSELEYVLKYWDNKTFRLHENMKVVKAEANAATVVRPTCPPLLGVMRQQAPFHIRRIGWQAYKGSSRPSKADFMCLCCNMCSSALVDWLSDGRFCVGEADPPVGIDANGSCYYAIKPCQS
jgi:prevent-host-death family protein